MGSHCVAEVSSVVASGVVPPMRDCGGEVWRGVLTVLHSNEKRYISDIALLPNPPDSEMHWFKTEVFEDRNTKLSSQIYQFFRYENPS